MLKIENITKEYITGDIKVKALKGLSLEFRKNEFVSILGPSGCGKTTLLNIIGGLDRYTTGDLIINGKSTKEFKDKDWDTYRNHSIGFVFQSYNLIPHQTILQNVELALTLSGVNKEERRKRAISVLTKVGLKDKIHTKPNQLSGGQMQRVAIARALVNDPEIILADEPTGALDSKTSVQIMNLLKEISKDKLIIMVTHNPSLAKKYSSRIVKLLDGELVADSKPVKDNEEDEGLLSLTDNKDLNKKEIKKKNKKTKMSFFTALSLSFKNLLTKKGRTILVSIAGSIGIIGIALILAISSGFSTYINKMQEDTLATYPITVEAKKIGLTSIITSMFMKTADSTGNTDHALDGVYDKDSLAQIMDSVGKNLTANNLTKFKEYIEDNEEEIKSSVSAIKYSYDLDFNFYTDITSPEDDLNNVQPSSLALVNMIVEYSLRYFEKEADVTITPVVYQGKKTGNYTITAKQTSSSKFLSDYESSVPGLTEIKESLFAAPDYLTPIENATCPISSGTVISLAFKIINFGDSVSDDGKLKTDSLSTMGALNIFHEMIDNANVLKSQYEVLATAEGYENLFDKLDANTSSDTNDAILVLDKNNEVDEYVLYALGLMTDEQMSQMFTNLINNNPQPVKIEYSSVLGKTYSVLDPADYYTYESETLINFDKEYNDTTNMVKYSKFLNYAKNKVQNSNYKLRIVGIVKLNDQTESGFLKSGVAYTNKFTEKVISGYNQKLDLNADLTSADGAKLTKINTATPAEIFIYVNSFDSKAKVKEFIEKYNSQVAQDGDEITYDDTVDLIMSTVSTIINAITYVLIAFVSVSLVVSSIMIGIITYISVIERTKEIGILRSVGASKKDVKRVFTAESFIIGLTSGVFGIVVSLILTIPINILLKSFTGIGSLATLPVLGSVILIAISVVLTLISGLIPARAAAKKDPVIALRTD